MKITINKFIGVHVCSKCAWTLSDADFIFFGIQITAETALCFDYKCPNCEFLGRWSVGLVSEDRLAAALDMLKNIVVEVPESKPRRNRVFRRDGNRLSGDQFNKS